MNQFSFFEAVYRILLRGGWVMLPLFIVGFLAWILIVYKYMDLFNMNPKMGKWLELSNGLKKRKDRGIDDLQYWLEEWEIETETFMNKHLRTIAQLAAVAPLIGLLGTVSGMRATFGVITQFGFGNPAMLADGISESLLTTQSGLVIAFPILLAHNFLRNKANRYFQIQKAWAFEWLRNNKGVSTHE